MGRICIFFFPLDNSFSLLILGEIIVVLCKQSLPTWCGKWLEQISGKASKTDLFPWAAWRCSGREPSEVGCSAGRPGLEYNSSPAARSKTWSIQPVAHGIKQNQFAQLIFFFFFLLFCRINCVPTNRVKYSEQLPLHYINKCFLPF